MTNHEAPFKTIFNMDNDQIGSYHRRVNISKHMESLIRFINGEWVVSKDDTFDFSSCCKRGGSGDVNTDNHYICIYGLKDDESMGALNLDEHGYNIS